MFKYFLKRLGFAILALIILLILVFFLVQAVPGYPIVRANNDTDISYMQKVADAGLLDDVFTQFGRFVARFFETGQFGQIYTSDQTVYERMFEPIKFTLLIAGPAFIISSIVGILFGIVSAYYRGRWPDIVINAVSVLFISIPSFILALYLIQLAGAMGLPTQFVVPDENTPLDKVVLSMIIPILSMVLSSISTITYYTRNELVDVFKQDYINVALAKGYSFRQVVFKYAIRNAMIPIVASLLPSFLTILTGSIIIEKFFNVPGTAIILIDSINKKEIYLVIFSAVFYGAIYFILQIIVDMSYTFIDPRIVLVEKNADSWWKRLVALKERKSRLKLATDEKAFLNYFSNKHVKAEETYVAEEVSQGLVFTDSEKFDLIDYDNILIDENDINIPKVNQTQFQSVDIYNLSSEQISGKPTKYVTDVIKRFFKSKPAMIFSILLSIILVFGIITSLINFNAISAPMTSVLPSSVLSYLPPRISWLGVNGVVALIVLDNDTYEALLQFEHLNIWSSVREVGAQWEITNFNPYNIPGMEGLNPMLGTDGLGRNWWDMLWYSTIKSFMFALIVSIPSVIIGTAYGAIAGSYAGRMGDTILMRIVEILSAVPLILWIMILGLIFSGGTLDLFTVGLSMVLVNWMWPAVTARTYILKYKDAEFVQAARTLGASQVRIVFQHMLPNISGRLFVRLVTMIPRVIFFEASLVFLGIKSVTEISLGTMIETSRLNPFPHLILGPTIMMILLTLSSQIIANNLNDALDPKISGE